ncbi:MAG: prolyl oligopeptidase family serine peptidase [bacterium]|nr:prolyl oligopeptidase family serine peptidase [bacterium]
MKKRRWILKSALILFCGLLLGLIFAFLRFRTLRPEITFLAGAPVVDGVLDAELTGLPVRNFPLTHKSHPENPLTPVHYRMAYGTDFLYLYLEMEADRYVCRDRGYQNGDGIILVIADQRPLSLPSGDFVILGFSPQENPEKEWARKILWYRNTAARLTPLGEEVEFEYVAESGVVGFELLLPWKEIYPFHPWLSRGIGLNLAFIKAVGENRVNYHIVFPDFALGVEGSNRTYARLSFEKPVLHDGIQSHLVLDRNHTGYGGTVRARWATLSSGPAQEKIRISILSEPEKNFQDINHEIEVGEGLSFNELDLATGWLLPGDYRIQWTSDARDSTEERGLTVYPKIDFDKLDDDLRQVHDEIAAGSFTTLEFRLRELRRRAGELRPYETCADFREELTRFPEIVELGRRGQDLLASTTGHLRRAFRSAIDQTLQPYSVQIPEDLDPTRKYPLLVFLHGSSRDDQGILKIHDYLGDGDFIKLAPRGRGRSNYFTVGHAQADIREATADAVANYPIDEERIVLAGFSMGGYGVYRTFFETPEKFKGLAVFSGEPRVPRVRYAIEGEHPNFLEEGNLHAFRDVPVFIFHGRDDRNCPFELTEELVEKLEAAGARVEFHVEEGAGHGGPPEAVVEKYRQWLAAVFADADLVRPTVDKPSPERVEENGNAGSS